VNTYKKKYTDDQGTYGIFEVYPDGRELLVSESQDLYQEWLAAGNAPEEVPYTEPEPDPEPDPEAEPEIPEPGPFVPANPAEARCHAYSDREFTDDAYPNYPTVDQLHNQWVFYAAEGNTEKAAAISACLAARKAVIRAEFPDA
jgi:hypothetical protein